MFYRVYQRFGIHIGVGFCVARSTELGNAKASQRGTGDGMDSHAFFVYKTKQFINRYIWEATAQMLLYEALLLILGAPDKPCGVGRADANPKLLLNDT